MSRSMQLHYISVTAFSLTDFFFRSNYPGIRLPRECDDQSQETSQRHCVTGAELPLFTKKKGILK